MRVWDFIQKKVLKENPEKSIRISYMKKYFIKMLILIAVLVGALVYGITGYSKKVVGDEIISLHQSILSQSVGQPAQTLADLRETLEKLTENTRVVDWIKEKQESTDMIHTLVQNEVYGSYKKGSRFRICIYDEEKLRYASDQPEITWEGVQPFLLKAKERCQEAESDGFYLEGPVWSEEENGLYRHSFYLVRPVEDLLDGEIHGYVLMQFSEVVLYDTYAELNLSGGDYSITDGSGIVVSARNKQEIGKPSPHNEIVISNRQVLGYGYGFSQTHPDNVYFYENISGTDWYLLENADLQHIFAPLHRAAIFSVLLAAAFLLFFLPVTICSLNTILKPIGHIKDKMNQVALGAWDARIGDNEKGKGELSEIADSFNYMAGKLESQVEEIRAIDRRKHLLELDFLQTQINPHFIHNTLSSIRFYVEMGKNEEAEKMLIDFSKILRKTLSSSEKFISLKEETETLNYYVELQKVRYRDRFEVEFRLPEETHFCIVPDFILQPIVENAIFYSLVEKQVCHIVIESRIEGDRLLVSVKDDGIGMDEAKLSQVLDKSMNMNKVGLRNVNERLRLNYGEAYGIRIISLKNVGTEVIMELPVTMRGNNWDENIDCR